jgi:pimeloyl-ACP methyl ester carboxylesterase
MSHLNARPEGRRSVIVPTNELEITHQPGSSDTAIVVFTGIGMGEDYVQIEEFRKSLDGTPNHILFVKDKTRTWYNGQFDNISSILRQELTRLQIRSVVTVGNSMGGFGAIAFAGRLPGCSQVLAFAAQTSVDPAIVPWEGRWWDLRQDVRQWCGLDATKLLDGKVRYNLFFGADGEQDMQHAYRFAGARTPLMTICVVKHAAHNCARILKKAGAFQPIVDSVVRHNHPAAEWIKLLDRVPHQFL